MKSNAILRPFLAVLLGTSAVLVTSCASPPPKSAKEKDYIEVYDTGSNLPRRIPKDKKAADASTASQTQSVDPDALAAAAQRSMVTKTAAGVTK